VLYGGQVLGPDSGRALLVARVLPQPGPDVGADRNDGDSSCEGIVQEFLDEAGGEALPGVVLADGGVVKNPFGSFLVRREAGSGLCR